MQRQIQIQLLCSTCSLVYMSWVETIGGLVARWPHARRWRRVGDLPTETEFPGEMKPAETQGLSSSRMGSSVCNKHLLTSDWRGFIFLLWRTTLRRILPDRQLGLNCQSLWLLEDFQGAVGTLKAPVFSKTDASESSSFPINWFPTRPQVKSVLSTDGSYIPGTLLKQAQIF